MGHVYRGLDTHRSLPVAIKLMHERLSPVEVARFAREVEVLAQLDHPGIVAHVAHGHTDAGEPYLVMDWLEGEDLAARLRRQPLTAQETVVLARRVALALEAAHGRGVVHRDLKPGNLFLRDGRVDRVTLVDFGIARQSGVMPSLTRAGGLIGTPGYIAPEQARGLRSVGPAADIFALGCVIFECLTGRSPFAATHIAEALARVLFDLPPKLSQQRPDLPGPLSDLLADMLVREPELRIPSARQLILRIDALPPVVDGPEPVVLDTRAGLGGEEQRLVNVIIASPMTSIAEQETVDVYSVESERSALTGELTGHGARVELMADGSLIATLAMEDASAVDQAMRALELARLIRDRRPDCVVALATGRGVLDGRQPLGEALTRAGELLPQAVTLSEQHPTARILLEDVTAGLVASRVRTVRLASGVSTLHDEAVTADASRPLLGKPTPCLGREQEISTLEMALRSTLDDGAAHAVLVIGPPGIGKSRVRHEFLRRVALLPDAITVIAGRAEAGNVASAYAVLRTALRTLFQAADCTTLEARRERVRERVARHVPPDAVDRVSEFLGELADVPFDDRASVKLRGARQDPRILRDQIASAWLEFLRAECAAQPVLLLLEDLHWGDRPSADLVELALRDLPDQPLMAVAFARPEVAEHLPGLWKGRAQELPLRPLPRRACEQLVEQVLGTSLAPDVVARIVAQAAGNALFLEELIRATADGKADRLPATVLAMLQSRIGRLEPELRRVLRAASIFGEAFLAAGAHALLGQTVTIEETAAWLRELQQHEIVELQRDGSDSGEAPLRFRHALMREAAYSLLTDADRTLGHRLAAAFLQEREGDPAVIAGHYVCGNQRSEAIRWFIQAAERAYDRDDHAASGDLATQAMACNPEGEQLGILLAIDADSRVWRWDWSVAQEHLERALPLVPSGSPWWCRTIQGLATLIAYRGKPDGTLVALCTQFAATDPPPESVLAYAVCAANVASSCTQVGLTDLGARMLQRAQAVVGTDDAQLPSMGAWRRLVRCTLLRHTHDDLAEQLLLAAEGLRLYREGGASAMMIGLAHDVLGELLCRVGDFDAGLQMLHDAVAEARRRGMDYLATHGDQCLANGLIIAGHMPEAETVARTLLARPTISVGFQAMARHVVAQARLGLGDLSEAENEARAAIALSAHTPIRRLQMMATLVTTLTRADRPQEACTLADEALTEMAGFDGGGYAELALLHAAAEAHRQGGDRDRARDLASRARLKLHADADKFLEPAARVRFLTAVPLHAAIVAAAY